MTAAVRTLRLTVCGLAVLAMAGCTQRNVASTLGLGKRSPDEFQVVRSAPLVMPPNYQLRPPTPGAPRPQEGTTGDQVREALVGTTQDGAASDTSTLASAAPAPTPETPGGRALIASMGGPADPDIRNLIGDESVDVASVDRFLFGDLFGVLGRREAEGTPIDPAAEAARLRGEQALTATNVTPTSGGGSDLVAGAPEVITPGTPAQGEGRPESNAQEGVTFILE
ncbi:DUF3035 domain-containing protein [Marinivivus vitaminiproducens]|uniref:DUF3035 domain-containing protein n=1 Tax=Marinivivus vitaminiproducens TaxID=3035935 RepID=UPI0027AB048B|nr:DUF3035 domain-containing protein [Geminicoccaceae bacterium SCSIO 64248]